MSNSLTCNNSSTASGTTHACGDVLPSKTREVKVKFSHKLMVFTGAVIALSWFFEGCRQIQEAISFQSVSILLLGTLLTILFLGIHSYWIYLEEKLKGTLKKRIELFEKVNQYLASKNDQYKNVVTVSKEDEGNCG